MDSTAQEQVDHLIRLPMRLPFHDDLTKFCKPLRPEIPTAGSRLVLHRAAAAATFSPSPNVPQSCYGDTGSSYHLPQPQSECQHPLFGLSS